MVTEQKPDKPEIKIDNPDAGKIKVIVSGDATVKSSDPKVVIVRK